MRSFILGGAGAFALVLAGTVTAVADNGDGLEACNSYEICFSRDADNNRYQKHYFGSDGDHSNNYFWDSTLNSQTGSKLEDNAYKLRNRDGSCYVRVTDWNGAFPSVHDDVPNNSTWTTLNNNVRNQNNEHKRCP
jgi:hypothetical protein